MDNMKGIKTLLLNGTNPQELREKIRNYFHQTFSIDEKLYECIAETDGFYMRADPLRHPIVFYLGHTAVFYINKLNIARIINTHIDPEYESMYAVGVDEMSWDDLNESHYNWHPIPDVLSYRAKVRSLIDNLISTLPLDETGIHWNSPWWAIIMGIEHQRIHLETSSVLIRQLPLEKVRQLEFWDYCHEAGIAPQNELIAVSGARVELGKQFNDPIYGWDNEYGSKSFLVKDFKASRYLVSNGEFLSFVEQDGYQTQAFWTQEGWAWKTFEQAEHPRFWKKDEAGNWMLRTIASLIPLPWNHPVEVNYLEAKAFCNWLAHTTNKPLRLPTEAEWYRLRNLHIHTDQPFWDKAPGNIHLEHYASACPVDKFKFGEFYDLIGNVWQWTETAISAYPGFQVHPYYDDFSVPTFDTRHNLIKGGSFISTGNEACAASRYAFRRHFYQHAGFRYVESLEPVPIEDDLYEKDPEITPWCDRDWGDIPIVKNFSMQILELVKPYLDSIKHEKALNFGCKTGRMAFELARYFNSVIGLDSTARIIRLATHLKEEGFLRYYRMGEGEIFNIMEITLESFGLASTADKCQFWQADSANMPQKFTDYDLIVTENVLEQSINPLRFLSMIHERLNPGGLLVIADAYGENSKFSTQENRLGGYRKDGEPYSNYDGLSSILQKNFVSVCAPMELLQTLPRGGRYLLLLQTQVSIWKKR
ncbi:MAG: 5-histidylcysteine sulfoxide synthase [Candidatus Cloacimonetes bacterium]|nr:5-histidylcysteine sulfoxide synthase [Candidatus Cloacimonadota bacterium]